VLSGAFNLGSVHQSCYVLLMWQGGEIDCRKHCHQFTESWGHSAADVTERNTDSDVQSQHRKHCCAL